MRGNGLSAESYQEIAEVDPATADALLQLFRDHDIAAYVSSVETSAAETSSADEARLRLFVDAARSETATELLDRELTHARPSQEPEPESSGVTELDEEAAWSQIVAAYDQDPNDPVPRWPASEDADPDDPNEPEGSDDPDGDERTDRPTAAVGAGSRSWADTDHDELPPLRTTDETERFVPPTPPPLPRLDPVTKAAWLAVLGAPAIFILTIAFRVTLPNWLTGVIAAGFIGGMIALFMRLKSGPPDDTDDGAVV